MDKEEVILLFLRYPITIFSVSIDKVKYCSHYSAAKSPYNLCLTYILERFVYDYMRLEKTAILVLEARGKREDKEVLEHIKGLLDRDGASHSNSVLKQSIVGAYFNGKWGRSHNSLKTYFGLEVAGLCSYPIHKFVKTGKEDKAFECIKTKIYGFPQYYGQGLKIL
ncbi:MAG: DUF3800 domain-containing protein [Clostridia bacterium]|nr:DUF3800 domain-containing protein [Clostridia bacterium]